jgi:DNA-binding GntR family transcriptional regulator
MNSDQGPLYRRVANSIIDAISDGTYPVGRLMPTEQELSAQFGVSRHTVREAVRQVQGLGLVSRRQGQGTLVRNRQARRNMTIVLRTFSDIEQHGYYTQLVDLDIGMITADAALATDLHAKTGDRFLHMRSLRIPTDDSMPVPKAWNDTYVVADYADVEKHIATNDGPVYLLIERLFDESIGEIEQDIAAVLMDGIVAAKLGVKARSAGLQVKRVYKGRAGTPVMVGINTYAGERFAVSMRIRPDKD